MRISFKRLGRFGVVISAVALLTGCATTSKRQASGPVFFPGPPDEPRIQFLTSFREEADIVGRSSFKSFIVGENTERRPVFKPYGVTLANGKMFICDGEVAAVDVVDLATGRISYFRGLGEGTLGFPVNIAIDADGTRYIADTKRGQVVIFSAKEQYLGAIGVKDQMKTSAVVLSGDKIFVSDLKGHCVRVYDKATRNELYSIPRADDAKSPKVFQPTNLALDPQGRLHVADTGDYCVKVYDVDGKYERTIGQQGDSPGQMAFLKGIAVDNESRVYTVDAKAQVVQLFDSKGQLLMYFGDAKSTGGGSTSLPYGVAVDYTNVKYFEKYAAPRFKVEYLIVLANQYGRHKVSVFGFGRRQ